MLRDITKTGTEGEAEKAEDPEGGEAKKAQDPQAEVGTDDTAEGEAAKAEDPEGGEEARDRAATHKMEADLRRARKTIEELRGKLAERDQSGKSTEERVAELERRLKDAEEAAETERANAALTKAGCIGMTMGAPSKVPSASLPD